MRFNVAVLKLAAAAAFLFNSTDAQAATPEPRVERVVMLMRHGIRPPTKAQPIPKEFSSFEWPRWTVEPGLLTKRGAQGIALLATSDRSRFINQGLLPDAGCPGEGRVVVRASNKPRAIETAEIWTEALAPGCPITVQHPGDGGPDPLFHGLDGGPEAFDARRAYTQELNGLPRGGLGAEATRLKFPANR